MEGAEARRTPASDAVGEASKLLWPSGWALRGEPASESTSPDSPFSNSGWTPLCGVLRMPRLRLAKRLMKLLLVLTSHPSV